MNLIKISDAEVSVDGVVYERKVDEAPDLLWIPEDSESYYAPTLEGDVVDFYNFGFCNSHKVRKEASRIYKTAEAALAASDYEILYLRYVREIARLNHEAGWVCDWSDGDQLKKNFAVFRDMLHEANTHLWQYVATELHFHESAAPKLRELFTDDEIKQIIRGHV